MFSNICTSKQIMHGKTDVKRYDNGGELYILL